MSIDKDAQLVELRDTLRTLLQRYRDFSFMESPEWDTEEEVPVKDAQRILDEGASETVEEEFRLLRKMSKKLQTVVSLTNQMTKEQSPDAAKALGHLEVLADEIEEMKDEHHKLLRKQGIIRSYG